MKAQILKYTGLTEKQFYAKYKTADDFFNSKEGKSFKRAHKVAQSGSGGGMMEGLGSMFSGMFKKSSIPDASSTPASYNPLEGKPQAPADLNKVNGMLPSQINQGNPKTPVNTGLGDTDRNKIPDIMEGTQAKANTDAGPKNSPYPITPNAPTADKFDFTKKLPGMVGKVAGVIQSFRAQNKKKKEIEMMRDVTGLQLKAARTRPEQYEQKYVRPEDQIISQGQLPGSVGAGTNVLTRNGGKIAQDGSMIPGQSENMYSQGNPGEIQNTYAPYDIYSDMGYQPLNDTNLKQYQSGGGTGASIAGAVSGPANKFVSSAYNNNAGYQAGNVVGEAFKFIPGVGPIVKAIASPVLGAIGGQLDRTFGSAGKIVKGQAAVQRNVNQMAYQASVDEGRNNAVSRNGSNWNPQLVKYYGNHSMNELLKPDPMMDTLQDGGYARGGAEIHSLWGGDVRPQSYNPYMDGSGVTYNSHGNSHRESDGRGRTGIGISVAQNGGNPNEADVEVERNEPIAEVGGDKVVYGNLYANMLGDSKYKNKRIKNIVTDLNKKENKHTKSLDKNTEDLNDLQIHSPIDKLSFNSYQANMTGNHMNLQSIAGEKQKLAHLQDAINSTRDEISDHLGYTVSAEQLSKNGQVTRDKDPVTKKAKWGAAIERAQSGTKKGKITFKGNVGNVNYKHQSVNPEGLPYTNIGEDPSQTMFASDEAYNEYLPKIRSAYQDPEKKKALVEYFKNYEGPGWENVRRSLNKGKTFEQQAAIAEKLGTDRKPGPFHINPEQFNTPADVPPPAATPPFVPTEAKKSNWWDAIGAALPNILPSNAEALNPNQLLGEMYAMSNNQVEPVFAQGYQPQLDLPYDISLQDQLNQVTAQTRAAQRTAGYNPAAQAMMAAQSYAPANQVLGEQFRQNQALKAGVYDRNRATMNEARLKNLGIFDQQANRQSTARSNTKQVNKAALDSISSKLEQHEAKNKELQVKENLYNYRYGPNMKIYNANAPWQPNMPTVYQGEEDGNIGTDSGLSPIFNPDGTFKGYMSKGDKASAKDAKKEKIVARNGSIVKSLKRM